MIAEWILPYCGSYYCSSPPKECIHIELWGVVILSIIVFLTLRLLYKYLGKNKALSDKGSKVKKDE